MDCPAQSRCKLATGQTKPGLRPGNLQGTSKEASQVRSPPVILHGALPSFRTAKSSSQPLAMAPRPVDSGRPIARSTGRRVGYPLVNHFQLQRRPAPGTWQQFPYNATTSQSSLSAARALQSSLSTSSNRVALSQRKATEPRSAALVDSWYFTSPPSPPVNYPCGDFPPALATPCTRFPGKDVHRRLRTPAVE